MLGMISLASIIQPASAGQVIAYVGHLHNLSGQPDADVTPQPCDMVATTRATLISTGDVATRHDTGVIWFENCSSVSVIINQLHVATEKEDAFKEWGESLPRLVLDPNSNLVLAEASQEVRALLT
jgi:hypothetical protein